LKAGIRDADIAACSATRKCLFLSLIANRILIKQIMLDLLDITSHLTVQEALEFNQSINHEFLVWPKCLKHC